MPKLVWDNVEDRSYESGLDKGVLYLPDGSAVPWNGLTSVIEKNDTETAAVYFDGMKINDVVVLGDFSATMKALTYPDEFETLEGLDDLRRGVQLGEQQPKSFGLAYRTKTSNLLDGDTGYKIHILYNITAVPSDKTYASLSQDPNLVEFEWNLLAVPEEVPGFRPSSHLVIDSRKVDPWLLEEIEKKLYGDISTDAYLISMADLVTYMRDWFRVKITDNGDGTWTAETLRDGFISYLDGMDTLFQIIQVNAIFLNDTTYQLSDTIDASDVPEIKITWFPDGTWSATADSSALVHLLDATTFEILNANATFLGDGMYRITDTTAET